MELSNGRWIMDFDRLERAITPRTRLLLLCSPHNPAGRAFSREELVTLADTCLKNDIVICSDEIHCGLILDQDKRHIPTAILGPEVADRTITLMAPSKTYNLPGFGFSFAIISNVSLRRQFRKAMSGIVPHLTALSFTAALAAYRDGQNWLDALLIYLRSNRDNVTRSIREIPGLRMTHVEATYLAWIDTAATGLKEPGKSFEEAGVGLSDGRDFAGPGFLRLNFGCPSATLAEGLSRMKHAIMGSNDKTKED
jgi:cystathionine beta-lyase